MFGLLKSEKKVNLTLSEIKNSIDDVVRALVSTCNLSTSDAYDRARNAAKNNRQSLIEVKESKVSACIAAVTKAGGVIDRVIEEN